MVETLEMMKSIKEIFDDKPETEEKDDMWSKIGKIAGPVLAGVMNGGAPKPAVTGAAPAAQINPGAAQAVPKGLIYQMPIQFQMMFRMGLAAARKNSDPVLYYDLLIDQMDEAGIKFLQETLTGDDWCAKLFGDETQVADIRPWLDELRQLIITHGTDPVTPEPPAGGEPPAPDRPVI
jgi:hypothetical protein